MKYDVVGIGNAIVDVIARCDDGFLEVNNLPKGHMRLIDSAEADQLYQAMAPGIEASGGSAANTMAGIASFQGRAAFIGRVADDQLGKVFAHDMNAIGVSYQTLPGDQDPPTARSLILVTPDGERTMNTFLGASVELGPAEIDPELITSSAITYLEGYLFDPPEARAAFHQAAEIAATAGRMVSLSLSDGFCVDRHRAAFRALVKGGVDLLFANEDELLSLYETDNFDEACRLVRAECKLTAVTRGASGSVVLNGGDEAVMIPPHPVAKVVDTTGAGDLYAAGFLYGYARGADLATCGQLASLAAAEVISHMGARPETALAELAREAELV